jgi:ribosomal protein S18 acetylase RimI-like enzyme
MAKRSSFPIRLDKWDSSFFKVPIARLHISGRRKNPAFYESVKYFLKRAKAEGVKFVFIRFEYPDKWREKMLLRAGIKKCGDYVNLVHHWRTRFKIDPIEEGYMIRPYKGNDLKQVCEIAGKSFRLSYFYNSGFAPRKNIDLYHEIWVRNQTKNRNYLIFVTEKHGEIAGFVTMNLKNTKTSARMSLMAVHNKHRGKGLGTFLIKKMLLEACRRKKDTHFKTQEDNRYALPIYTKIGCRLKSREKMFFKKI